MFLFSFQVVWFGVSGKRQIASFLKNQSKKHKPEKMTGISPAVALRLCPE
jgi:hypothetical protein